MVDKIPVLEIITANSDGTESSTLLTQSVAIVEYIDEVYPGGASLLPKSPLQRAHARQVLRFACEKPR